MDEHLDAVRALLSNNVAGSRSVRQARAIEAVCRMQMEAKSLSMEEIDAEIAATYNAHDGVV